MKNCRPIRKYFRNRSKRRWNESQGIKRKLWNKRKGRAMMISPNMSCISINRLNWSICHWFWLISLDWYIHAVCIINWTFGIFIVCRISFGTPNAIWCGIFWIGVSSKLPGTHIRTPICPVAYYCRMNISIAIRRRSIHGMLHAHTSSQKVCL